MKKIDKYLLSSFIGPFVVSFGIALFVLVMQFLWLYIDEIAGKGVSIFILIELITYMSISTFPMALPIAVLIASVMVMGNLAERYELSSMKSAGIPLIRIMRGIILISAAISCFSYFCSDYLIPESNLKFKSRLYDIRRQKPALTIEEGLFNEDFRAFVIRIGKKEKDGETIRDVMIEDQSNLSKAQFNQILADSGQMYTTKEKRFFVMNLFNGTQYQEPGTQAKNQKQKYPFIRTNFGSWTKVWDMKEFEMVRTEENRFSGQRSMLSMNELRANMDTLKSEIAQTGSKAVDDILLNLKKTVENAEKKPAEVVTPSVELNKFKQDRLDEIRRREQASQAGAVLPVQELKKPLNQYKTLLETFRAWDIENLRKNARNQVSAEKSIVETRLAQTENRKTDWVRTGYELYIKYSFALVCFIFLFIGAPMGAIIRKGGFGYPILVSIIFFVAFIFLTILCRKLAESYVMTPFWAAMMPCLGLIPIGFYLTRMAMNDSQLFSSQRIERLMFKLRNRFLTRKEAIDSK
ncbi:MAG: LptF/LptG family permease [Lewinellaceae bacterium]|nr:LptF/LptG family permease [Lewinellaceae bacterium]